MKATLKKTDGLRKEFEVVIPAAEIKKLTEAELKKQGSKAKIAGFRPGKAPIEVLKKHYGDSVNNNVLNNVIRESVTKALDENKIRPAQEPDVKDLSKFEEGKDFTYNFSVEAFPEVPKLDLKKIKVQKPVVEISEGDVQEALKRIADGHKHYHPIKEKRATKKGDVVNFDFEGSKDGVLFPGGAAKGHQMELGSGQFIPGFEDQMIGMNKGDEKTFDITFPKEYHSKDLAGQKTQFKVNLNEILEVETHDKFDDEFAKHLGLESYAKLEEEIKKQLKSDFDLASYTKAKKSLFDKLDKEHVYDVPAGMIDLDYKSVLFQMKQETPDRDAKEMEAEAKKLAERRVRLGITLSDIASKNKIEVTNDEIRQSVFQKAMQFPGSEQKVIEFYQKNPNALEQVRGELLEDKAVKYILDNANIEELKVTREELFKEDEEETTSSESKPKKTTKKKA